MPFIHACGFPEEGICISFYNVYLCSLLSILCNALSSDSDLIPDITYPSLNQVQIMHDDNKFYNNASVLIIKG